MVAGESNVGRYSYEGVEKLCYYRPVSRSEGWSLCIAAPVGEMTSSIRVAIFGQVIAAVIMLILAFIIMNRVSKKIAVPIVKITKRMELLAEGDLSRVGPISKSKDEVGLLTRSVAETVVTLKQYIRKFPNSGQCGCRQSDVAVSENFKGEFIQLGESLNNIVKSVSSAMADIGRAADQVSSGAEQVPAGRRLFLRVLLSRQARLKSLLPPSTKFLRRFRKQRSLQITPEGKPTRPVRRLKEHREMNE